MIITADDFGFTEDVNLAIINLLNDKLITQASLMVNQPGTLHALNLIKKYNLTNIGLHFNLTQGQSLSNPNVTFSKTKKYSKEFIQQELDAQIQFFKNNNIYLHHIDTHHNIHLKDEYLNTLLQKYGVPVRLYNAGGFDCDGDEYNFLYTLFKEYSELGTHVALSTRGLYDTILLENRVKEYEFFYKNQEVIRQVINGN